MKKVLVAGGAGFIGSNIVDLLIDNSYEVVIVDNLITGKLEFINDKAKFYNVDIKDRELFNIFAKERPNYVIHHAAQISVSKSKEDPLEDASNNILGSINLLECCKLYGVKKIIYASSAAVYGNTSHIPINELHNICPLSNYGISKHTVEHYLEVYKEFYGIMYTILRYSNVYGLRQSSNGEGGVISIFINNFLNEESPVVFGSGEQTRDFIYVKDVAKANLLAIENGDNEIINISSNSRISINEVLLKLKKILNHDLKVIYEESRDGDILHSQLDNEKAKKLLDFNVGYTLNDGLIETIEYYKSTIKIVNI